MHPRQAQLISQASDLIEKTAAKGPAVPKAAVLWKYSDPEGRIFYLEEKLMTVKSPYSGKSFSAKPVKHTPSQVGQDLKTEIKEKRTEKKATEDWKA